MRRLISYLLVSVQFLCLLYLAVTGPWIADGWLLVLEGIGLLLGLWAIFAMGVSRVRVLPDVRPGAQLVLTSSTDGSPTPIDPQRIDVSQHVTCYRVVFDVE